MIDEKRIPQRIYIKDYQLAECEIEGVADARINAVPYKGGNGNLCESININSLWHDASEEPEKGKKIITQFVDWYEGIDYELDVYCVNYPWECWVEENHIIKWCYLSDII